MCPIFVPFLCSISYLPIGPRCTPLPAYLSPLLFINFFVVRRPITHTGEMLLALAFSRCHAPKLFLTCVLTSNQINILIADTQFMSFAWTRTHTQHTARARPGLTRTHTCAAKGNWWKLSSFLYKTRPARKNVT